MRILNEEEKKICQKILERNGNDNNLSNLIDDKLEGFQIDMFRSVGRVELLFQTLNDLSTDDEAKGMLVKINTLSREILTTVNLIELLHKEGYILLYQRANKIENHVSFGGLATNLKYASHEFGDKTISRLLIEYSFKEIVTTHEFEEFCRHGFIARDERRFKRQIRLAYLAFGVALFAAFTNLGFNLWNKLSDGTTIKQEQIDTLSQGLKSIENRIDLLPTKIKSVTFLIDTSKKVK